MLQGIFAVFAALTEGGMGAGAVSSVCLFCSSTVHRVASTRIFQLHRVTVIRECTAVYKILLMA